MVVAAISFVLGTLRSCWALLNGTRSFAYLSGMSHSLRAVCRAQQQSERNLVSGTDHFEAQLKWIPAFAGMTGEDAGTMGKVVGMVCETAGKHNNPRYASPVSRSASGVSNASPVSRLASGCSKASSVSRLASRMSKVSAICRLVFSLLAFFTFTATSFAATLAPDAVDIMHHRYEGGGMEIDGPSVLVRKSIGTQVSVTGHYYIDSISAASVDVIALGSSEYTEERTEISGGIDYLHEKTIMSMGYTNSSENDYEANTVYFAVSQDFFGDLTTLTLGYARGWDDVGRRGQPENEWEEADRHNYKIGLSQVITRNMLMGLDIDVITDEGKLENPYRRNRYIDATATAGYSFQEELYPDTRTSTAAALRAMYYLPYRASVKAEYRFFRDTWGVQAHTAGLGYTHTFGDHWKADIHYRYYTQDQADFYGDLFPFENSQTHLARDKELSQYSGSTIGLGASYELKQGVIPGIDRLLFSVLVDRLDFTYDNFRDLTQTGFAVGDEPLYEFDALVSRISLILEY